ncbi:MAG: glycosyltransferase family 4 protein [Armatimonadota bacterium]
MSVGWTVGNFVVSFFITALLTPIIRLAALKSGWEYRVDPRKWKRKMNPHAVRIAMGGGFAMLAGVSVATVMRLDYQLFTLSLFSFCAAALGLYDDLKSPRPTYRLIIQALIGVVTVAVIGRVHGLPIWLAVPISVIGIVGLMNSVNMMDNMDGVASGLITLSMLGYTILGWLTENELAVILGLIVAGASLGFWVYNRPPAVIFMGDMGSLMLGYLLAITGIVASWGEFSNLFARLVAPLLVASVFITDTTFVVLWRKTHRLPVMQGDRNHISHRLAVLMGRSEWGANIALYLTQLLMNVAAITVALSSIPIAVIVSLSAIILLTLLCWRLWQVQVE